MITELDRGFMSFALKEAEQALGRGEMPIGAALVINDELIGASSNTNVMNANKLSHAETNVLRSHASEIEEHRQRESKVTLYSTLEPCLMCLSTSIAARVGRIVYACEDPSAGSTSVDLSSIPYFYAQRRPIIESGIFQIESFNLMIEFLRPRPQWREVYEMYLDMQSRWEQEQ